MRAVATRLREDRTAHGRIRAFDHAFAEFAESRLGVASTEARCWPYRFTPRHGSSLCCFEEAYLKVTASQAR